MQAKFRCHNVESLEANDGAVNPETKRWEPNGKKVKTAESVIFFAVCPPPDQPDHPNRSWSEATPSGQISMHINNPGAFGHFTPGKEYLVTFLPCD